MSIENTLAERGNRYGDFTDHARLCQDLKDVMTTFAVVQNTPNSVAVHFPWSALPATHKQALEVIADKIARILSGDPNYADNWHDIQGYAKLVEDRLPQPAGEAALPADTGCPHCGASELHQLTCPTQHAITVNLGTVLSPPVNPAEHLQRVAGMAITFGERVAIMDAYIKAGDTGETYTEYEARMLCKDQAPIDPADVDISDEEYPSDLPPDQWQKGDVVVALHNCDGQFSRLKRYTLRAENQYETVKVVADDRGEENGWGVHNFRFHSRPTK